MDEQKQLELVLSETLQLMANQVNQLTPEGFVFVLLLAEEHVHEPNVAYVTSIDDHKPVLTMLENWLADMKAGNFHLPDGPKEGNA